MKTLTLQICGTGSGVGKSVIVTALCRIFLQDGYKVCPFKAQNMSLNSFVTEDGGEMARAQVAQAQACRIEPHVDMNPVLIKPTADKNAQIILHGKSVGRMSVKKYIRYKSNALKSIVDSFNRLKKEYEVIVLEGAGSPAEINLKRHDIVNMKMAQIANAPVILTGDIDKGGVFASLIGTLELLNSSERNLIKGFMVNKFRGDKTLLKDGLDFLEKKTKKPVLGVLPYFKNIRIPEEDSVNSEKSRRQGKCIKKTINIAVIKLPHISNFTDFDSLENEPDVNLYYVNAREEMGKPDIIILPGTRNTICDLAYLKRTGLAQKIISLINSDRQVSLIGICGGYQMLGRQVYDIDHIESKHTKIQGLGLLSITTVFKKEKILSRIKAKEIMSGLEVTGYEIHHGRTKICSDYQPVFKVIQRCKEKAQAYDGVMSKAGRIWGTYLHGVFDAPIFRRGFLNRIRIAKKWLPLVAEIGFNQDNEFDKLADLVRENIDMKLLYKIIKQGL